MPAVKVIELEPHYFILDPSSEESKKISSSMIWFGPKFSPHPDVPRFYDISSITENPKLFKLVTDVFADHYRAMPAEKRPTHIVGFDARGFLIGAPLAVELQLPFVMMRKCGKKPGVLIESHPFEKEYTEKALDTMAVREGAIPKGGRAVLIDDLIATGSTAISGFQLVEASGATVVEFIAVIDIPFCRGVQKIHEYHNSKFKDVNVFTLIHDDAICDANCGDPKDHSGPRIKQIK